MKSTSADQGAGVRLAALKVQLLDRVPMLDADRWARFRGEDVERAQELLAEWRSQGQVLALDHGDIWQYPQFQFDEKARPSPQMAALLAAVGDARASWSLLSWLDARNVTLKGERPVEIFWEDPAAVIRAAQSFYSRED